MLLRRILAPLSSSLIRCCARNYNVTVVGAANDVGQTLALMLRSQPSITKLTVHDSLDHTPGVVLDLSHIPAESVLKGFNGNESLEKALKGSNVVLVAGGILREPGLKKKAWYITNIGYIRMIAMKIAKLNPMPIVGIVTEPVNSLVPMAAEIIRSQGHYDPRKIFGITGIDTLRAQSHYASIHNLNPRDCIVPVIGGHSKKTIIPLLSQAQPACPMKEKSIHDFTSDIRKADDTVTGAKRGWGPSISIAYSAMVFTREILNALDGQSTQVNAYVENNDFGTTFFSGSVNLDKDGAGEMVRYSDLSEYECHLLERSIIQLRRDVSKGRKVLEFS